MNVICLEEGAFFELVEQTLAKLQENMPVRDDKWVGEEEIMRMLRIKSKTTLQKLRDSDLIRYSQPLHKIILYDRESVIEYIEKHASR